MQKHADQSLRKRYQLHEQTFPIQSIVPKLHNIDPRYQVTQPTQSPPSCHSHIHRKFCRCLCLNSFLSVKTLFIWEKIITDPKELLLVIRIKTGTQHFVSYGIVTYL